MQNVVDSGGTMWYSTVKSLEIRNFAMHLLADEDVQRQQFEISGFLFVIVHKYLKPAVRRVARYGETDEMNTNCGKMQDCACIFS